MVLMPLTWFVKMVSFKLYTHVQQLGKMGTKVAELTDKYPGLTKAMGTAELALKALAVAGVGAAVGSRLFQRTNIPW